jgi:hypothetical protein
MIGILYQDLPVIAIFLVGTPHRLLWQTIETFGNETNDSKQLIRNDLYPYQGSPSGIEWLFG